MQTVDLRRTPAVAQNALAISLLRYGVTGAGLALAFSLAYESVLHVLPGAAQTANGVAFVLTTLLGYHIHSSWSFHSEGHRSPALAGIGKFLIVNLCSFALNGFWVWLLVQQWKFPAHLALLPILTVTPWLSFWFNRTWAFKPA